MSAPATPSGSRPRILVVEDDADLLKMLGKMVGVLGDVTLATDGTEAIAALERGLVPDLVLTDLMMPRMDGLTLARKLKENKVWARIPVVMLTAKDTPRDVIAGINAGARHYVTKPFKHEELLEKIRKALKK